MHLLNLLTLPKKIQNVQKLLTKLDAVSNISIPEALVITVQSQFQINRLNAQGGSLSAEERMLLDEQTRNANNQMLEQFTSMGYIKRNNGQLTSKLEFKQGQMMINGKALNSMTGQTPQ